MYKALLRPLKCQQLNCALAYINQISQSWLALNVWVMEITIKSAELWKAQLDHYGSFQKI